MEPAALQDFLIVDTRVWDIYCGPVCIHMFVTDRTVRGDSMAEPLQCDASSCYVQTHNRNTHSNAAAVRKEKGLSAIQALLAQMHGHHRSLKTRGSAVAAPRALKHNQGRLESTRLALLRPRQVPNPKALRRQRASRLLGPRQPPQQAPQPTKAIGSARQPARGLRPPQSAPAAADAGPHPPRWGHRQSPPGCRSR